MEWLDALILGIVQGLTEYLPVSSSGHLEIFKEILGINLPADESMQFDIIVHAATVCSTLVILWPMFSRLCASFFTFRRDKNFYYVCKLLVSCIPIAVVGFCFKEDVESFFTGGLTIVGICLCVTAFLLTFAHYSSRIIHYGKTRDITWADSFVIGCAQALAVLPGLSRSGTTIATGIILGDKRDQMAQFSFLMVIIPILGETMLSVRKMLEVDPSASSVEAGPLALVVGFVSAFVVGCCACKWMINIVKKGKLIWFALYCMVMGVVCLLWN